MANLLSNSKLTPHNLIPNSATRPLMEAGARGIKCVDNFGPAADAKNWNPVVITIGRRNSVYPTDTGRVITAENLKQAHAPEEAAIFYASVQDEVMRLNPQIDYWEGTNEPSWEVKVGNVVDRAATIANYTWYARFDIQLMKEREKRGKKAVIGCFSTGVPDINQTDQYQWKAYLPALQYANDHGHLLGLHEYRDNTGRYRLVYNWVLSPNNLKNLKIVITEFSTDDDFTHDPDDVYINKTIQADQQMRQDTYLLFATIFTYGSNNTAWNKYDRSRTPSVAQAIVDRVHSQINIPDPIPPVPVPTFVDGVDVSHYQGKIIWTQLQSNYKFAICKVGQGSTKDITFDYNWAEIKKAGLIRGCYQYFLDTLTGDFQADLMINALGGKYTVGDIVPILDIEGAIVTSEAFLAQRIGQWVNKIKDKLGVIPIIYTNPSFAFEHNLATYGCELWIANYNVSKPAIPKVWDGNYRFWQYKVAPKGTVRGIDANIDLDRYNGTLDDLKRWVGSPVPVPPIPTPPVFKFKQLDTVSVANTTTLNVRNSPLLTDNVITTVPRGTKGYVMRNGVLDTVDNLVFYKILYENDVYGWSTQNYLEKI